MFSAASRLPWWLRWMIWAAAPRSSRRTGRSLKPGRGEDGVEQRLLKALAAEAGGGEERADDGPPAVQHVVAVRHRTRPVAHDEPRQRAALEPAHHRGRDVGVVPEELLLPVLGLLLQQRA